MGNPGYVAQTLAKEAVFGTCILETSTPSGSKEWLALPQSGLWAIKEAIFQEYPQHWAEPSRFEEVWQRCHVSIEQACGRLRRKKVKG